MEKKQFDQLLEIVGKLSSVQEERLAEVLDHIEHVCEVVRENTERLGVIEDIFEEMRVDTQWAVRNILPEPFILTSFPVDPAAKDWQINRLSANDLPKDATETGTKQRELF